MNADSAQPRKASNVTRPFPILWVGSGDETSSLLALGYGHKTLSLRALSFALRACGCGFPSLLSRPCSGQKGDVSRHVQGSLVIVVSGNPHIKN